MNGVQSTRVVRFITAWKEWLATSTSSPNSNKVLDIAVNQLLKFLDLKETTLTMAFVDVVAFENISAEHKYAIEQILEALKNLPVYQVVTSCLPGKDRFESETSGPEADEPFREKLSMNLKNWHYVTILLLMWPYEDNEGSFASSLNRLMADQLKASASELLQNEVTLLRQQVASVLGYVAACNSCKCKQKAPEPAK